MLPDSYEYLKKPLKPSSEKTKRQQQKIGWAVVIVVFTKKKIIFFIFGEEGKVAHWKEIYTSFGSPT